MQSTVLTFNTYPLPLSIDVSLKAGSFGGTAAILRAMAANPSDPEMQGEACTAVTNLSHNCDRNRRVIVEGGGLVLILNAMQARGLKIRCGLSSRSLWGMRCYFLSTSAKRARHPLRGIRPTNASVPWTSSGPKEVFSCKKKCAARKKKPYISLFYT